MCKNGDMPQQPELPGTPVLLAVPKKRGRKPLDPEQKRRGHSIALSPSVRVALEQEVEAGRARSISEAVNTLIEFALEHRKVE